jgi:outer membrane biosynthesis protein TonB
MQLTFDPMLDAETPSQAALWTKRIVIILLVLLVLVGIGYGVKKMMSGGSDHPKKKITPITLKDLPPPPPPPPPKEQPKEQPKDQPKEVKEVPQPKPVETPPTEVLKMDGPAGDGPSPFAAGSPTSDYKSEELGNKIGGGVNKHQFDWYTGLIKEKIEDAISKNKDLATGSYKLIVKVWVAANGQIQRYELENSTGDAVKDNLVKKALDAMPPLSETPPNDMPQPVKLRVTARSMG